MTSRTHVNSTFRAFLMSLLTAAVLTACASSPQSLRLDPVDVRPWSEALGSEYPNKKSVIAHYRKGGYELIYLAAGHSNDFGSATINLVDELFSRYQFDVLLIEPIPFSSGESPKWFLEEAKSGLHETFIAGGESSLAVIYADKKKIPFYSGEPDHPDTYQRLRAKGYSDQDIISFYLVRQIPQWVRSHQSTDHLLEQKAPAFTKQYCKTFAIVKCPSLEDVSAWYLKHIGHPLTVHVHNDEVAPVSGSQSLPHRISSDVGFIRDHFTLQVIETLLLKHKRIAVIYGAGHFITLRRSFDRALGEPSFIEGRESRQR